MRIGISISIPGGSSGGFSPLALGPTLWLRADLGVSLVSGNVAGWADQSGNAHDFAQGTVSKQPLFEAAGFNGQPSILTDGVDDVLVNNTTLANTLAGGNDTPWTIFVAAQSLGAGNQMVITFGHNASSRYVYLNPTTGGTEISKKDDAAAASTASGGGTPNAKHIFEVFSAGTVASWLNEGATLINAGTFDAGQTTLNQTVLPGMLNGGTITVSTYRLAEVIAYPRALSAPERQTVRKYLGARYGVTVA